MPSKINQAKAHEACITTANSVRRLAYTLDKMSEAKLVTDTIPSVWDEVQRAIDEIDEGLQRVEQELFPGTQYADPDTGVFQREPAVFSTDPQPLKVLNEPPSSDMDRIFGDESPRPPHDAAIHDSDAPKSNPTRSKE